MKRAKLTATQRIDDNLADAEAFIGSSLAEINVTVTALKKAGRDIHMKRMRLARVLRKETQQ